MVNESKHFEIRLINRLDSRISILSWHRIRQDPSAAVLALLRLCDVGGV